MNKRGAHITYGQATDERYLSSDFGVGGWVRHGRVAGGGPFEKDQSAPLAFGGRTV
jgi:hypothetical protein